MNFTEEQLAFRDSVRRMAEQRVAPIAAEMDEKDRFPTELVKLFGEMGLMQLWVPEKYGGPEGNLTMVCIAREEISRFSPAAGSIAGLNTMFSMPLLHFGSEEQRQRFLPKIAAGGVVTAIAISEPQAGSDVSAMTTRAVKDGDSYVINGRKQWCSYGVEAEYIALMARTAGETGADGISCFVIEPKKMKGISFGRHERKMGWRGAPNTPIFLDNVRVPAANRLGAEGEGFKIAMSSVESGRLSVAARCVGMIRGCLALATEYAKTRETFGEPIGRRQLVQSKITDMRVAYETARLLVLQAAWKKDNGERARADTSMAKMYASDALMRVAEDAMQIHGAYSCSDEYEIGRYWRDAKFMQTIEGSNEIHRGLIAEYELGYRE